METVEIPLADLSVYPVKLADLIVRTGMADSKSEASRLIQQKAVRAQFEPTESDYPWETLTDGSGWAVPGHKNYYYVTPTFLLRVGRKMKKINLEGEQCQTR